jgi:hypothetical protein
LNHRQDGGGFNLRSCDEENGAALSQASQSWIEQVLPISAMREDVLVWSMLSIASRIELARRCEMWFPLDLEVA